MSQLSRRNFCRLMGVSVATVGLGLVGCGGGSSSSDSGSSDSSSSSSSSSAGGDVSGKTVAFIPKVTGNAFFESANNGAQEHAKKWGFTVDYVGDSTASVSEIGRAHV